ncbi:MAG: DUF2617 family protein [Patescibacteria group bacterium]
MNHRPVYADQSAHGLKLHLLTGEVGMDQFEVVSSQELLSGSLILRGYIIGASHVFTLLLPDARVLNEVFACVDMQEQGSVVKSGSLGELDATLCAAFWNISYSFSPRLLSWKEGEQELISLRETVAAAPSSRQLGLAYEFPKLSSDSHPPLTLVWAEAGENRFSWKTAHCYPNENHIVFTETKLVLS